MAFGIGLALLLLSLWQPVHVLPWMSWHSEVLAFASASLLTMEAIRSFATTGSSAIRLPTSALVFVGLLGVLLVQSLTGMIGYAGDALVLSFYLALCIMALLAGFMAATKISPVGTQNALLETRILWFAIIVLVAAIGSTVLCLAQSMNIWDDASWIARLGRQRRPGANLGQPNHLSTLLLIGVASLIYVFRSNKLNAYVAFALLFLLVLGIAITESRTGLVGFLILAGWCASKRCTANLGFPNWVIAVWCLILPGLMWFWPFIHAILQVDESAYAVNVAAGTRLQVWPQLLEAAFQRPWFGWGLREISTAHNAVLHTYSKAESFAYAHNLALDLAVGIGFPLTVILVVLGAVWLRDRVKRTKTVLGWYCLALVLPIAVHSMFEYPFAYAYFLLPALYLVGVLEGVVAPKQSFSLPRKPVFLGFCLITGLMAWSAFEYVQLEEDFRVARFESMTVGKTPSDYQRPKVHLLTQLDALGTASRTVPSPGMSPAQIEFARKAAMRFPWNAIQNRYALILALNGNPEEAVRQLKVMRAMHGERNYQAIKAAWAELEHSKFPQLKKIHLP